jgi:hypothetical protein
VELQNSFTCYTAEQCRQKHALPQKFSVHKIVGSEGRQVNARTQVGNAERVVVWGTRFRTHSVFLNTRQMLNWAQSNYFGRAPLFMLGTLPLSRPRRARERDECSSGSGVCVSISIIHPGRMERVRNSSAPALSFAYIPNRPN